MEEKPTEISSGKMFGGYNRRYRHFSPTLGRTLLDVLKGVGVNEVSPANVDVRSMKYPQTSWFLKSLCGDLAHNLGMAQVLYWLSGLTCSDENFIIKSGAQRTASSEGIALVSPDTSPRGLNVDGEADSWDFGVGAGFYLNARQEKWKNWQMYDYVVHELPKLLSANFPQLDTSRASIFEHSMGGHGALTIYLKNLSNYKSVSAFAPITNPIDCPWGQKAFSNYLGSDKSLWEEYDATSLVKKRSKSLAPILIDQGDEDKFLHDQLLPHRFEEACKSAGVPLILRIQPGYDHSYYFISTFIGDHIQHHAKALKAAK